MRTRRRWIETTFLVILIVLATIPALATHSGSQPNSPSATLTGMLYDDSGVDSDGDGFYDYLNVGVQINVSEAGIYRVSIWGLRSSTGGEISISKDKSIFLDAGDLQVVNVSLPGPVIYLSGLNPVNVSYINLYPYSSWILLSSAQNVPLHNEYSYTDFDRPGASLTGVISDEGNDTDGDVLYNYLVIHVQVNVTEPRIYWVSISGLSNASFYWFYVYGSKSEYLEAGVQNVSIALDGVAIYTSGLNPRYVSYINLQDSDNNYNIESLSDKPLSHEYFHNEFDSPNPPPSFGAKLTGKIDDEGVDADGDYLFDYLDVGVEINVTIPSVYRIYASTLRDSNWNFIYVSNSTESYLEEGIHFLHISFSGFTIRAYGINPQYLNQVSLYYQNGTSIGNLNDTPLTNEYSYTQFEAPDASLTGTVVDQGVDTDGDGAFNYLQVSVEINVTKAGEYGLWIDGLRDTEMKDFYVSNYFLGYLIEGVQWKNITLTGSIIYSYGLNPRFIRSITLREGYDIVIDKREDVLLSREYSYKEFEPPQAELTGKFVDEGIDDDGNGHFDHLRIGVEVNITEAGTYSIYVSNLLDAELDYLYVYTSNRTYFEKGVQMVYVSLSGPKIYSSALNPRLIGYIYVQDQNWYALDSEYNVPLHREYSYAEFDPPGARLTGKISDRGVDTDGDGFFNYLEVQVEVEVTEYGYYEVTISDLLDSSLNYISTYSSWSNNLDVGTRTVTLNLDGLAIRMSGRDPAYVSNIYLRDQENGDIGKLEKVPLVGTYSHLEFEPPKVMLTGKIYDYGVDRDGDGKYDYLVVGVEINVTNSGNYGVEVSGLKDTSKTGTLSISNSASDYFDVGVHVLNVSLHGPSIYASQINPRYVSSIYLHGDLWMSQYDTPLSREYLYTEFDHPDASLTGNILDFGVDNDGDGKFNYLQVDVEVNVTEAGYYQLQLSALLDSVGNRIDVGYNTWIYLNKGLQIVYFSLEGLRIRLSGLSPRYIERVSLYDQDYNYLGIMSNIPLSREYSFNEFEMPGARFTGVVSDQGEDTDGDGKYNYLKLSVQLNVTEYGYYRVEVQLRDGHDEYKNMYASADAYLNAGINWLNVSFNGLSIYLYEFNPSYIGALYLKNWNYELDSLFSVQISREYSYTEFDAPGAVLTGTIFDEGVDTDADETYDYLRIGVEVDVADAGYFRISAEGLRDSDLRYVYISNSTYVFLETGLHIVYVDLAGPPIFLSHLNPRYVDYIWLWIEASGYQEYKNTVPLSRMYSYKEFDPPAAVLTGKIHDHGVDTDGDGAYNFLEIDVEINVTKPGSYSVQISELLDKDNNWISVWGSASSYLETGTRWLNVSLDGRMIYAQKRNPMYVYYIYLYADYFSYIQNVQLSKEYSYTLFDFPAVLTGVISDNGVDSDSDGLFDYLEIGVQINVADSGKYYIYVSGLYDANGYYISVYDYKIADLTAGIQTVSLYLYGPQIYASHRNPARVNFVALQPYISPYTPYPYPYYQFYDMRNNLPLSRQYDYTEFEAPLVDVETKFIVYPDGRVGLSGALNYTNMIPENTPRYTSAEGYFDLTGNKESSQASAKFTASLPELIASETFPYNSSTAALHAQYANGILNFGLNSSMTLPQYFASQYPFNSTDGSVSATYSGGILNINAEGDTTFPPLASQQSPFNAVDIDVVGSYSPHTLDGTMTFSLIDGYTFDDVNVDFTGNQTDFALSGSVNVIYNVPFSSLIIHNETELDQMIQDLRTSLLGESGIIWTSTGGRLNATNVDITHQPITGGATVTFTLKVHGDFVQALAYVLSEGRNESLLSPVLDEAYQDILSGSFDIKYSHATMKASVKLSFSYNLKHLLDYVTTPPAGTVPLVVMSSSMMPTLWMGDLVLVNNATNAGDITANPENGDIIAFSNPSDSRQIIIHRAINKTYSGGAWYFTTKGDNNYSPDYWTGPNTLNGQISENLVIGKVVQRIPMLGYVVSYPYFNYPYYYYPYSQTTTAARLSLLKTAFDSLESMSAKLSYSNLDKRFDFNLTQVGKLKTLIDAGSSMMPQLLMPDTPPEVRTFFESLVNMTYATVDTADISFTYGKGKINFDATATINGDLSKEANYVKDIYFQLVGAQYSRYHTDVPWQIDFINQTKVDIDNFKISAKLGKNYIEGNIDGLIITPPKEVIDSTHFNLENLFSLTAPEYSWQREFPQEGQRLRITIEGGSNSTHTVTLVRPASVPTPDITAPYQKSMTWYNQTLSSLKDLVFKIKSRSEVPATGTLKVATTPVAGEVFVNSSSWGLAPQSRTVDVGTYNVTFGPVSGYYTSAWKLVTVSENAETLVTGVYTPITGTLKISTTPINAEIFVNGQSWGTAPQQKVVQIGTYNVTFGAVSGYRMPTWQLVSVYENQETTVKGTYTPIMGTLTVKTTPVAGEVFVNGVSWGHAPQSREVQIGTYGVTFGAVNDFTTPANQVVTVKENKETIVEGAYQPLEGVTVTQITHPELIDTTHPVDCNAIEHASTSVTIYQISDPVTITIKNVTIPEGVTPPAGTWKVLGCYTQITLNDTDITVNATMRIYYTLEQLQASGLDENTLKIHYWDANSNQWVPVESHVNTDEHYLWATIDHFSLWAIMGQTPASTTPLWLIAGVALIVAVILVVVAYVYIRKRKQ